MDQVAYLAHVRDRLRKELKLLCQGMLWYKDWDRVHDELQAFLDKPSHKKAILLPRGHLKTSIVTVGVTVQAILRDPNVRVLIANQVWDIARSFLRAVKGHLETTVLPDGTSGLPVLFGQFVSQRWNEDEIIVRQRSNKGLKEPTVMTTGVEAETTGGHYDLIILDDLTGHQNSSTPEQREKTKRFRRSMIDLLEPGGKLLEIGTRWHLDDTFSEIFEKEAMYYDIMVRKVVENGKIIFPRHFAKKFDAERKDWVQSNDDTCMDYVEHLKASHTLDEFYAQYMNEPLATENQIFPGALYRYWNDRPTGLYTAMAVDLAISKAVDADYTAITVLGMDKEWNIYVLDYIRGHWSPSQIVDNVFNKYSQWKPYTVGMETNGFQRTLKVACEEEMRRRRQYFGIEEIRTGPEKSKESRIKSLEPFYRQGKVFHASWMKGKEMEVELLTFPKGKHDDLIDAMAMTLPLLSPGVSVEQTRRMEGTWEAAAQFARNFHRPYRSFIDG